MVFHHFDQTVTELQEYRISKEINRKHGMLGVSETLIKNDEKTMDKILNFEKSFFLYFVNGLN